MAGQQLDRAPRLDLALALDRQVVPRPAALEEPSDERVVPEADPELVAGQPRLRDDELGGADAEPVADGELPLERQPLDGEVLAEHAPRQRPSELTAPGGVVLGRVDVDGLARAAVDGEVGLAVAVQVEPPDRHRPLDRLLEDRRAHGLPLPGDLARKPDVDGDDAAGRVHLD